MNPPCEKNFFAFPDPTPEESKTLYDISQKSNLPLDPTLDPAAYKKKKSLKLLTTTASNGSSDDPEKYKLFTPQPPQKPEHSMMFLNSINCMSHAPRKIKTQNSSEFHDFFYQDEVHEVVMRKCGHKTQEDRVKYFHYNFRLSFE